MGLSDRLWGVVHIFLGRGDLQAVPIKTVNGFYRAMLAQSAIMRSHVVRPSVRLSVCNV